MRNGSDIVRRERKRSESSRDSTSSTIENESLRKRRSDVTVHNTIHINSE